MTPNEKLATALEALHAMQAAGRVAVRSRDLTRPVRELLIKHGFLQEVLKGWYIQANPGTSFGETTAWYTSFWGFCRDYLNERFGNDWALTPAQSLILHAGNTSVPSQLLVRARAGTNKATRFLHGTSLFETNHTLPAPEDVTHWNGMNLFGPEAALVAAEGSFFEHHPTEARTILSTQRDASALSARLLKGGHTTIAGRLAGGFRNLGRDREADDILKAMHAADYRTRETDPFKDQAPRLPYRRDASPYVQRIRLLWHKMRPDIAAHFPVLAAPIRDIEAYMAEIDAIYVTDAYHSLSIEGYQVSTDLIDKVRSGRWNPKDEKADRDLENALAARGYWQAFQRVKNSVRRVLDGINPGEVVAQDLGDWYRELFIPRVTAGILKPENIAGYRTAQVYLRGSRHVPLNSDAVRDTMPAFLDLLTEETDPAARIVLGHFIYVYIHPYMDGNGRTARFMMNVMMAAAGLPWTVIPVQSRTAYMAALEAASVDGNIVPFTRFLASQVGRPVPDAQ